MGRRRKTFALKGQAEHWAGKQELQVHDGDWIDPKGGETTVGELWDRYGTTRRQGNASRKRDESHWRRHVAPRWAGKRIGPILKPDITGWVVDMERAGTGAASIEAALGVLRSMLEIAVDARLIRSNPTSGVRGPRRDAHLDRVLDDFEDELLLNNLDARFPDRPDARLFVEVLLYCGLRYEEAAALDRDHVDMRQRGIHVGPVMEKSGLIRPFPKSAAGVRFVPVDDDLWPRIREHVMTVAPGGMVFTAPGGGALLYDNWRYRVWSRGLLAARLMSDAEIEEWKAQRRAEGKRPWRATWLAETPLLADPQPTPHDLRHTYGTRLGEDGMPPHEIMSLMGHADLKSVQRYLHAREGRFDRARRAMHRTRGRRIGEPS
jgi:integrase